MTRAALGWSYWDLRRGFLRSELPGSVLARVWLNPDRRIEKVIPA